MRKYNNKTKKTMIIILILFAVFVVIFSLFLKKSIEIEKTAYNLEIGSILYDNENNKITTQSDAVIKIRWGGDYYLKYQDENINIGKHVVVYNSNNGDIALYGKFYEVKNDGKVDVIEEENIIKSSVNSKFYKLADRKYLIIDRTIQTDDSNFVTSNYLMVNLDKSGNANLINDKTSLKTIKPTVLRTSSYKFDIANEILNYGKEDIDLKKIIGSTNEYDPDKYNLNATQNEEETGGSGSGGSGGGSGSGTGGDGTGSGGDGTGTGGSGSGGSGGGSGSGTGGDGTGSGGDGTGDGTGGSGSGGSGGGGSGSGGSGGGGSGSGSGGSGGGSGSGSGGTGSGIGGSGIGSGITNGNGTTVGNNSNHNNNYDSEISDEVVDEIINATKNTSVIRITPGINNIVVDYVVYDPNNEYKSVYLEVENTNTGQTNVVYLSKTDTKIVVSNLIPNVYYNLTFKYSYKDKGNLKEYTFDQTGVYTKIPELTINVSKIVNDKIYYKIRLDDNYTITGGTVNLLQNGKIISTTSIPTKGNVNEISGNDCYFDISKLGLSKKNDSPDLISLKIVSLSFNTYTINPGTTYKFKY